MMMTPEIWLAIISLIGTVAGLYFNQQLGVLKQENKVLRKQVYSLQEENDRLREEQKSMKTDYDALFHKYEKALISAGKINDAF